MPGSDNQTTAEPGPQDPDGPLIEVQDVSKDFGSLTAVSHVSFAVERGKICGLVGSDGAGKTTLLRMMATMIRPTTGNIFVRGLNIATRKAQVKAAIGYMPQRFGLYQDLTVGENLDFFMDVYGITGAERKRRRDFYLGFSNLLPFVDRKAGDLSGGMKQKLGLACVLVHQPEALILDEPTNGVDPVSRQEFWDILAEMKRNGMTILVSTAYLDEGEKCDQLVLMHNARILAIATPHEIQADFSDLEEAIIHRIQATDNTMAEEGFGS
jgi:ABC-type multidrug transport system ATPase subunit